MTSKKLLVRIVAIVAAWIALSAAFVMLLQDLLWPFGITLSSLVAFVVVLSLQFRLLASPERERFSIQDIGHVSKREGYLVEERPGKVLITIDRLTRIAMLSRQSRDKEGLFYKVDPTPLGWSVLVVCSLMYLLAPIGTAIIIYMLARTSMFAERQVVQMVASVVSSRPKEPEVIREYLIDGLSDCYLLSTEALDAERSNYQDSIVVVAFVGILFWMIGFVLSAVSSWSSGASPLWNLYWISVVTIVLVVVLVWLLRRRYLPRIEKLRGWPKRFQDALSLISSEWHKGGEETCAFDLLVEATSEVPDWLEIRRKSMMY